MKTLAQYIADQPKQPMRVWADRFDVSRSYLTELIGGKTPSVDVAERIARATGGAVPISSWPNHAAVLDAVRRMEGGTQ
jgi:hypothetical protein